MTVIGLGLVGGSLARALTGAGHVVTGVDTSAVLRRASRARAIARGVPSPWRGAADAMIAADIVVLAAPPRANRRLLDAVAKSGTRAIVTDVGSVKGPIVSRALALGLARFVGGHPMAGTEGSGFAASDATLFAGRRWILTPARGHSVPAALRRMIAATGAQAMVMTAAEHDRAAAFLSHVPQVVAWALARAAAGDPVARRRRAMAGPGFRDMTRLAKSPRPLWREILQENRAEVRRALRALMAALRQQP